MAAASRWFLAPTISSCAVMIEIVIFSSESTNVAAAGAAARYVDHHIGVDQVASHLSAWIVAEVVYVADAIRDVVPIGP